MSREKSNPDYPPSQRAFNFLRMAQDFYNAYKRCPDTTPPNYPKYFLGCHCIELALKAFLLSKGVGIDAVIGKGHNLESLLRECGDMGLSVSEKLKTCLPKINEIHGGYWNRYPMERSMQVVLLENIDDDLDKLMIDVNPYVGVASDQ